MLRVTSVLAILTTLAASATAVPQFPEKPADFTGHRVVRVIPDTRHHLGWLRNISKEHDLEIWNDFLATKRPVFLQIPPRIYETVRTRLSEEGLDSEVVFEDFQRAIDEERQQNDHSIWKRSAAPAARRAVNKKFHSEFHRLSDVDAFTKKLARNKLATLVTVGTTYEDRDILALRISSSAEGSKPAILVQGGIHAREWVSTSAALYIADRLLSEYDNDEKIKALVDKYEWHVIPCANPDGYVFSWDFKRTWRKNRSKSKKAVFPWCRGTDPNRNFDSHFCEIGASLDPCSEDYCGDTAFSERESVALSTYMKNLKDLQVIFDLHSFSQYWLYPYGYTKQKSSKHDKLASVAEVGVAAIKATHGLDFVHGPVSEVIYEASGSAIDWAIDNLPDLKLVYALELRDQGKFAWMLPKDQILPAAEETFAGIVAAINAM